MSVRQSKALNSPEKTQLITALQGKTLTWKSSKQKSKALKSAIKTESALLEKKTKDTIEGLSDEQVIELLKEKWIRPLIENLMQLPDSIVSELVSKLEALAKKYETTFAEVESQIEETEKSLSAMIDDLDGSEFDMLGLAELKKLLGGSAK